MDKSIMTRLLHGLLALAVIHQLAVSLVMEPPKRGHDAPGLPGALFDLHEGVGLFTLGVVVAFWLWTLVRRRETPVSALLPWFFRGRRRDLAQDLAQYAAALRRRRMPEYRPRSPLPAAVHGLGLLVITAMGATGAVIYFTQGQPGVAGQVAKATWEVHEALANLAWAYFIGHAALGVLHGVLGHDIVRPMFRLRASVPSQTVPEETSNPAS
jgi:cytochrome b561